MKRLEDKVIIVTGSCTGIGKAIALRCVEEGAKVVIHGLEEDWGQALVTEIGSEHAILHIEDITNPGCTTRLVKTALNKFGRLNAIVNNAAYVAFGNIHDTDEAEFTKVLAVNTIAPYSLIRAALSKLSETNGCVLNIGSVNAHCGEPNLVAYSPSKGALMTLTRNLGDTLFRENGVRVNQINPGWVLTENEAMRKQEHGLSEEWYKDLPAIFAPAQRIFAPREIANAAIFWLSDEAGPVSGQVVDLEQYPLLGRNLPKDTSTIN